MGATAIEVIFQVNDKAVVVFGVGGYSIFAIGSCIVGYSTISQYLFNLYISQRLPEFLPLGNLLLSDLLISLFLGDLRRLFQMV